MNNNPIRFLIWKICQWEAKKYQSFVQFVALFINLLMLIHLVSIDGKPKNMNKCLLLGFRLKKIFIKTSVTEKLGYLKVTERQIY